MSLLAIAPALLSTFPSPQTSLAQAAPSPDSITFWNGFEPPGDGAPEDTSGAGSRDGLACNANEPPIRALMPARNFGLTLAEQPTVFVELPETSARQVALIVTNEAGTYYERAFLPMPEEDVAAFTFPETFTPLTAGHNYRWSVVVMCEETVQPDDPVLSGWIQPVVADRRVSYPSPIEQAQWYAQNGYWYDLLSVLQAEVQSHPDNQQLQSLWRSVLEADLNESSPTAP